MFASGEVFSLKFRDLIPIIILGTGVAQVTWRGGIAPMANQ
jgi:hypothetical protein